MVLSSVTSGIIIAITLIVISKMNFFLSLLHYNSESNGAGGSGFNDLPDRGTFHYNLEKEKGYLPQWLSGIT